MCDQCHAKALRFMDLALRMEAPIEGEADRHRQARFDIAAFSEFALERITRVSAASEVNLAAANELAARVLARADEFESKRLIDAVVIARYFGAAIDDLNSWLVAAIKCSAQGGDFLAQKFLADTADDMAATNVYRPEYTEVAQQRRRMVEHAVHGRLMSARDGQAPQVIH